jgi:hypothetical protein
VIRRYRASVAAGNQSVGSLVRSALEAAGLQRHGRACYLISDELIWVVTPEQLWSGPSWAVRVGAVARWLSPDVEWPSDGNAHLQTEARFMTGLRGADAEALDGPAVGDALRSDSGLAATDRSATLGRFASVLHMALMQLTTRGDLAQQVKADLLPNALIVKDLRAALEL